MKPITIGKTSEAKLLRLDAEQLLETRLLIQGASGSGKSWIIRGLAEKLAKKIPTIILDLEGEFVTLREQVDLVVAGEGGDTGVDVRSAGLLARKLLELQLSAVVDLSDLTRPQRKSYVRYFLEAIMQAPRSLWGPRLIVLDEAHEFAPESGKSEALAAVIDLASRGRKRGFCLVAATQRLSKLHKDVAAELRNVMIGHTTLDVDVKRALDTLGKPADLPHKREIRGLEHEFYAMGPAISQPGVTIFTAASVKTTHPQSGARRELDPPQPSRAIQKVLGELADLPEKAEEEAKTLAEAKSRIKQLEREVKAKPKGDPVEVPVVDQKAIDQAVKVRDRHWQSEVRKFELANGKLVGRLEQISKLAHANGEALVKAEQPPTLPQSRANVALVRPKQAPPATSDGKKLGGGALRMVVALADRHPAQFTELQWATLSRLKKSGGTWSTYKSKLLQAGLVEKQGSLWSATDLAIEQYGDPLRAPQTAEETREQWKSSLGSGPAKMIDALLHGPMTREQLAEATELSANGGTFSTYLSKLSSNGLIAKDGYEISLCEELV